MNKNTSLAIKQTDIEGNIDFILDCIRDIKGKKITQLDLREVSGASADIFIVCQGDSTVQVSAIANNIYKRMKAENGSVPISYEGKNSSKWVLIDYFNIVVHIFHPETREFYNLEALWNDAKITTYEDI